MKITAEKDQQSQVILRIEIDPQELDDAKTKAARKLSNQLRIPGFRPGKAPRALVERFVGQEGLLEQATKDLIPKAYRDALAQQDIRPIGDPEFNIESNDPLTIVATIPVEPTVELGSYQDIRFEMPPTIISEEEVQKVVEQLRDQQSTWEEPDTERPAQEGDQVELEMYTLKDGEISGEAVQRTGVLGKGELLGQIDEQVRGMSVGEEKVIEVVRQPARTEALVADTTAEASTDDETAEALNVEAGSENEATHPEQSTTTDTAAEVETPDLPEVETIPLDEEETTDSTPMSFKVTLNSVKIKHEPELNDEFAQSVTDVKTMDELLVRVRENLKAQKEANAKRELSEKIVKEAVALSTVSMPPALVNSEIHTLEQNMAERLKQNKLSLDQYLQMSGKDHEAFHEELRPQAEERIKTALVLREIARAENVTVEQGDLDREVEKMVDQFSANTPEENRAAQATAMRSYLAQKETTDQLRDELFSRKLSERLLEMATGMSFAEPESLFNDTIDIEEDEATAVEGEVTELPTGELAASEGEGETQPLAELSEDEAEPSPEEATDAPEETEESKK